VERARELLGAELAALVGESYERAYGDMVRVQQLTELEETVDYSLALALAQGAPRLPAPAAAAACAPRCRRDVRSSCLRGCWCKMCGKKWCHVTWVVRRCMPCKTSCDPRQLLQGMIAATVTYGCASC